MKNPSKPIGLLSLCSLFVLASLIAASSATAGPSFSNSKVGDFNGDGYGDLLIERATDRALYVFITDTATGHANSAYSGVMGRLPEGWAVAALGDVNNDNQTDIILVNAAGVLYVWVTRVTASTEVTVSVDPATSFWPGTIATGFSFAAAGDANGDGKVDVYIQNDSNRLIYTYIMGDGVFDHAASGMQMTPTAGWALTHSADLNFDFLADMILFNSSNQRLYYMLAAAGGIGIDTAGSPGAVAAGYLVDGLGDFSNNGQNDLMVAQDGAVGTVRNVYVYATASDGISWDVGESGMPFAQGIGWTVAGIGDYSGDGIADSMVGDGTNTVYYIHTSPSEISGFQQYQALMGDWFLPIFEAP